MCLLKDLLKFSLSCVYGTYSGFFVCFKMFHSRSKQSIYGKEAKIRGRYISTYMSVTLSHGRIIDSEASKWSSGLAHKHPLAKGLPVKSLQTQQMAKILCILLKACVSFWYNYLSFCSFTEACNIFCRHTALSICVQRDGGLPRLFEGKLLNLTLQ